MIFNRKKVAERLDDVSDRLDVVRREVKDTTQYRGWKALTPNMRLLIVVVAVAIIAFFVGHILDAAGVVGSIEIPSGEGGG